MFSQFVQTSLSTDGLKQSELIGHVPPLLKQLNKLLECDLQASKHYFRFFSLYPHRKRWSDMSQVPHNRLVRTGWFDG